MKPFALLIKPTSADCNLRCEYCFYLEKRALYPSDGKHRMNDETLRTLLKRYFATSQPVYSMIWQGGEPTLMGTSFFRRVIDEQKKLAPRGAQIANALQTNATLVQSDLATLIAQYRFLVGCSLDGPADLHDVYRRTASRRESYTKVVHGIRTLQSHGVPLNGTVLVSTANVDSPLRVYRHLLELGIHHIQFIPCVEFDNLGNSCSFTISGKQWGTFLLSIFEFWYTSHRRYVSIRNFDSLIAKMAGIANTECRLCHQCDQYLVVEYNGDVYPCDFFVGEQYLLGNLFDDAFESIVQSSRYQDFVSRKNSLPEQCVACTYYRLCMGDCPKFRAGAGGEAPSWLCDGWSMFFETAKERLESLSIY
nr:anaerobic sulfatase maturase [Desulfovibrio inopinatus]